MNNIKVIDNTGEKINVVINEKGNGLEIVINLANPVFMFPDNLKPGDTFKDIDGAEWILWYWTKDGNAAILKKENLRTMRFGENNNYNGSSVDKHLSNTYLKELERKFGAENIVEHEVDLLSLDGEDDYGTIRRKVSIPTFDIYRKHKKTVKKFLGKSFLLATPDSTPSGVGSRCVLCAFTNGCVGYRWYHNECGVRPYLILKKSFNL